MTPTEIRALREAFEFTPQDLAKTLNVGLATVYRWEQEDKPPPAGMALEVLKGLQMAAATLTTDERRAAARELRLGLGAFLFRRLAGVR